MQHIPFVYEYMEKDNCCGCEACSNICPVDAIEMVADKFGFLYPVIESDKCIECKLCVEVCPQLLEPEKRVGKKPDVYAGYSLNAENVASSSSGGIFSTLAYTFIEKYSNANIASVVWLDDFTGTCHVIGGKDRIPEMKRSKYIQSKKNYIYREIKQRLKSGEHILFVGCPCETAGLTCFLGDTYDNLFMIDLVCQGPTSPKVMKDYTTYLQNKFSSKIKSINLRYNGGKTWIPQWIRIQFENNKIYKRVFYETELGIAVHFMQRPSCFKCEWNGERRVADLTLGDFHGAKANEGYYNPAGTSIIILNTDKGKAMFHDLMNNTCVEKVSYKEVVEHNPRVDHAWRPLKRADIFMDEYQKGSLKSAAYKSLTWKQKIKYLLPVPVSNWINLH